jgi:hypothetical protein
VKPKKPEQDQSEAAPPQPTEPVPAAPILSQASAFAQTLLGPSNAVSSAISQRSLDHYNIFPETHAENPFAGPSPDDIVAQAQSKSKGKMKDSAGAKSTVSDQK